LALYIILIKKNIAFMIMQLVYLLTGLFYLKVKIMTNKNE